MIIKNNNNLTNEQMKVLFMRETGIRKRLDDIVIIGLDSPQIKYIVECADKKYEEFIDFHIGKQNTNQRRGQRLMNNLFIYDVETYRIISGSDTDCFYDDNKIIDTLDHLKRKWGYDDKD